MGLVVHRQHHSTTHITMRLRQVKEKATDVKLWKKKHAAERVRRDYRTADEVLKEASEKGAEAPRQTILDMRGPQVGETHFPCESMPVVIHIYYGLAALAVRGSPGESPA
jgi:hypothetical protein